MCAVSILMTIAVLMVLSIARDILSKSDRHSRSLSKHFKQMGLETKKIKKRTAAYKAPTDTKATYGHMVLAVILAFMMSKLLFKSTGLSLLLSMVGLFYPSIVRKVEEDKRQELIISQFRDVLNSIRTSLKSGLSLNSALVKCKDDLKRLHKYEKTKIMLREFEKISIDLEMGSSVDEALLDFGRRINAEDVNDFVNAMVIVREKGGNLVEVMDNVSQVISDKIEVKLEIKKLTAEKKQEAKIMSILPFVVVGLLSVLSPDYVANLYTTGIGKMLTVVAVILLIVNYFVTKRIIDIQI